MTKRGEPMRFFNEAARSETDECILWPYGKAGQAGYPVLNGEYMHRKMLEIKEGPCPDNHQACHSCHTPSCINPQHLRWDTPASNQQDRRLNGTFGEGEAHSQSRLTEPEVRAIRADSRPYPQIASCFGVSVTTVCEIKTGRKWKHLR